MKKLTDELDEILKKYFGKDYLRDIHTGESIDMTSEIAQARTAIISLMKSKQMSVENLTYLIKNICIDGTFMGKPVTGQLMSRFQEEKLSINQCCFRIATAIHKEQDKRLEK